MGSNYIAITPAGKMVGAKCINCIHYWPLKDNNAKCTKPNLGWTGKKRRDYLFHVCDKFED